ncbi:YCF48-related protein [Rhodoferax sp. GW822-FHT02A01]|uniref:WD40/YVTN/BNR-like repeat-containing protein n=1 Tax=Rhodoferax sp. GW822-FHT02A01 TaxID=3141537 RepID=UPI00315C82E2
MNSSIRLHLFALAVGVLATLAGGTKALAQSVGAPAALDRPALLSPKAAGRAMLTLARAGTRLVAAGERGIVLYSDDGGAQWKQVATPTSVTLVALRFADDKHGWAIGHMGVILHTEDGGQTWVKQLDGLHAAALVAEAARRSGDERAIARAERLLADGADKPFFDLHVENATTAIVVGAFNLAFRTGDGGTTWLPWQEHLENPKALHLHAIRKVGKALLIVGEQGLMLRSLDGGEHFQALPSPYVGSWFGLLETRGEQLIAYGLRGNAYVSADAGSHWEKLQTGTVASISAATQLGDGRVVLASQAGELLVAAQPDRAGAIPTFTPMAGKAGLPLTDVVQDAHGGLALASLRGVLTTPVAAAPQP